MIDFLTRQKMALAVALVLALGPSSAARAAAPPGLPPKADPRARGTLHLVAVGISESKNRANIALGAEANVNEVVARFAAQKGKLYQEVRVKKVLGKEATAARILATLDDLKQNVKAGDRVVVFFNAHGAVLGGQWRMAATDADITPKGITGTVTRDDLRARLEKLPVPVILLLDSCHSGAFGDGVGNRAVKGEAGLVVFAACLGNQYSINSMKLKRGLFSVALAEALDGKADANGDGVVTLAEVDAYVASRLPQLEREAGLNLFQRVVLRAALGEWVPAQTPTCSRPSTIASGMPLAIVAVAKKNA